MMKYTGDSIFNVSLSPQIGKPLDARLVVDTFEDLYTIDKRVAYLGMPVVHAGTGTICVLTDLNEIDNKKGWTNSYETVLIKMCTEKEYKEWLANTENNKPIDPLKGYIREAVYYYIKEDSVDDRYQYYVSYGLFKTLEDSVKTKATQSQIKTIFVNIKTLQDALSVYDEEKVNYLVSADVDEKLNLVLANYYLKKDLDALFVKKSDITGDASDSDFIFVSKEEYNNKVQELQSQLDLTLKTNSDGSLNSISVKTITQGDNVLDMSNLLLNGETIAFAKQLPKVEVMDLDTYDERLKSGTLDQSKYYMTYIGDSLKEKDEAGGYMTTKYFEANYIKKTDAEAMFNFLKTIQSGDKTLESIVLELNKKIDNGSVFTKQESLDTFLTKGDYLVKHQDISNKADKDEIPKKVSDLENDLKFISQHLSLDEYAKKEEIPDVSQFIKEHQDISHLALKKDIPTDNNQLENGKGYVTLEEVKTYLKENSLIDSSKIIDVDNPEESLRDFNAKIKDTYISKNTYKELEDKFNSLLKWAESKGYSIE